MFGSTSTFDGTSGYKYRDSSNTSWLSFTDGMLPTTGGTLTGNVVQNASPTLSTHLTTKGYVDSNFLSLTGGTLTGNVVQNASPTLSTHLTTKGYVDTLTTSITSGLANYVAKTGSTMTGYLVLHADPINALHPATKQYVDTEISTAVSAVTLGFIPVNKSGDTMTGLLTLSGDPSTALQAATKQYVDNKPFLDKATLSYQTVAGEISFSGDIHFDSPVEINYAPSDPSHAIQKSYVDSNFLSLTGGTLTGNVVQNATPTLSTHLTTKGYVDATFFPKTGGTITGSVTLNSGKEIFCTTSPTTANSLVNKNYVDTEVASVVAGSVNNASEIQAGIIELASPAEVNAGVDGLRAVTPLTLQMTLQNKVASKTAKGIVELATNAETITGTDTERATTPSNIAGLFADTGRQSIGTSGYQKLPGGLIIQWGSGMLTTGGTVSFPITFPNACLNVQLTPDSSTTTDIEMGGVRLLTTSNFTFDGVVMSAGGVGVASNLTCYWMAIGY